MKNGNRQPLPEKQAEARHPPEANMTFTFPHTHQRGPIIAFDLWPLFYPVYIPKKRIYGFISLH